MNPIKILVGSPVYQKPEILEAFLSSLMKLNHKTFSLDYMFVDDNLDEKSIQLLADFKREGSQVVLLQGLEESEYLCDNESHHWDDHLMLKVANYKNTIIQHALDHQYDYLFFVDSDLILHPNLIEHLKAANKDIVSEIFWSQWHPKKPFEPNVWLFDEYDLVPKRLGEELTDEEMSLREKRFLKQLRRPGLYEVGGLGACTLISRSALEAGINFKSIKNLTIHGEDRFFCIRAAVQGVELFVDTHYPAYHIYREHLMEGVSDYVKLYDEEVAFIRKFKEAGNQITLSMIVKNEEHRYLSRVLTSLRGHIHAAVIIDDGSTDNTIALCKELLKDIPLHIIENDHSMFASEVDLRKKQWQETIKTNPDWILNLDADEILEESFWDSSQTLIDDPNYDFYAFRLFDLWTETHYRDDRHWSAHNTYRPFLMRYQPGFNYRWNEIPQHCGRFPMNTFAFPMAKSEYRVKHLGWATANDRLHKYNRYQTLDPDAIYGIKAQYESILDLNPKLEPFDKGTSI